MAFTKNQERAIGLYDKNILVSAAAGSGKTSVLTERIYRKITNEKEFVDIDRMLVMTFTNAAAKEMKDRIRDKIERALDENPDNENLKRQSVLVHNANITTIHGFCQKIIKDHFEKVDIDPNFRIGDENECKLLRLDVLDSVLEEMYQEADSDFLRTVDSMSETKGDRKFGEMLMKFYLFSQSSPDPDEYLDGCIRAYDFTSIESFEDSDIMKGYMDVVKESLDKAQELIQEALGIIDECGGIEVYRGTISNELNQITALCGEESYEGIRQGVRLVTFDSLPRVMSKGLSLEDAEGKDRVQALRSEYKNQIGQVKKYTIQSMESIFDNTQCLRSIVETIVKIVRLFARTYSEKKKEKNIIDFNDMEHMAIMILKNNPEIAEGYREFFEEIYVDEYQDSNLAQESLIELIRRKGDKGNLFMVGDVKQSIYRFRQARPDLFIGKYNSYRDDDGSDIRIILNDNFRSRESVIDSVNEVFYEIMSRKVGGIDYDQNAALKLGSEAYKTTDELGIDEDTYKTEVIIGSGEELGKEELEAGIIADKICQMIRSKMPVFDTKTQSVRPIEYRDIVILLRSLKGRSEVIKNVLSDAGIPVSVTSREGYFDSQEIRCTLAFLSVIDNPLSDIELATIMRSGMFDFTNKELALLRKDNGDASLYESVEKYEGEDNPKLREKCLRLIDKITYYRDKASYTPVDGLLEEFIDRDYGDFVRCMDKGQQRMANLAVLMNKARDYGKTSFSGLFNFVRYISLIRKYEIDEGEAGVLGEEDNVVRIMTIHKSKGLEFPVCFLGGIEKKRNQNDEKGNALWDANLGLGIDRIDIENRVKYESVQKLLVKRKLEIDNLAEDIRVLYVAMTRAREKLIMVGVGKEDEFATYKRSISDCNSYLDMLCFANGIIRERNDSSEENCFAAIKIVHMDESQLIVNEVGDKLIEEAGREELVDYYVRILNDSESNNAEGHVLKMLEEKIKELDFTYPSNYLDTIPTKLSVSMLKHKAIEEILEAGEKIASQGKKLFEETNPDKYIPEFMRAEGESLTGGTFYGTAFHRILELWKYDSENVSENMITEFVKEMLDRKQMSKEQADAVRPRDIAFFLNSEVGKRLYRASSGQKLYREQPFVLGVQKGSIAGYFGLKSDQVDSEEIVLVQGIIDAFVEEDGELMILDYKTDRVDNETMLIKRYRAQLEYYKMALEQITGKNVKELVIYSSCLGRAVML